MPVWLNFRGNTVTGTFKILALPKLVFRTCIFCIVNLRSPYTPNPSPLIIPFFSNAKILKACPNTRGRNRCAVQCANQCMLGLQISIEIRGTVQSFKPPCDMELLIRSVWSRKAQGARCKMQCTGCKGRAGWNRNDASCGRWNKGSW